MCDLCDVLKKSRRSVSILSCLEISTISTHQDNRQNVSCAYVCYIYLPGDGWTIYLHKAWDHCAIIDEWAVESLKTVIDDGSHASFI